MKNDAAHDVTSSVAGHEDAVSPEAQVGLREHRFKVHGERALDEHATGPLVGKASPDESLATCAIVREHGTHEVGRDGHEFEAIGEERGD